MNIIINGPQGSGKSTVARHIMSKHPVLKSCRRTSFAGPYKRICDGNSDQYVIELELAHIATFDDIASESELKRLIGIVNTVRKINPKLIAVFCIQSEVVQVLK